MERKSNLKKIIILILISFFLNNVIAQSSLPSNVQKIIKTAFVKKNPIEGSSFLEAEISKLSSDTEKIIALTVLADYEERFDLFSRAAKHYVEAADLSSKKEKKNLLSKALGAFLLADNITDASALYSKRLLPLVAKPFSQDDIRILVLFEWMKLKSEEKTSLENIKKYVTDSKFSEFHPAMLLTLWWVEGDKKAENTLIKKFPNSIEAAVVRGEAFLSPKTFWYLMPQNRGFKEYFADTGSESVLSDQGAISEQNNEISAAKFYQTGFFKTENFAKGLGDELQKKGFTVTIKKDSRGDESFFSVLVKDDGKGDIVIRLKSEGYEAVPIFD